MKKLVLIFLLIASVCFGADVKESAMTAVTSLEDTDKIRVLHGTASNVITWLNTKAGIKSYADTLYMPATAGLASALPGTCAYPQSFFATDTKTYYFCTASNEWYAAFSKGADGSYRSIFTNNTAIDPTESADEIYFEANIFKVNQNGTEASIVIGPTAGQISFSGPTQARTITVPDAAVTIPANPIGGTLGATTNIIPKANGTGTATLQASGITEDGTNVNIGALNLITTGSVTSATLSSTASATLGGAVSLPEGTNNGTSKITISAAAALGGDKTITISDVQVDLGSLNFLTTGAIHGGVEIIDDDTSLSAAQCYGSFNDTNGTETITLPTAVVGESILVYSNDATVKTIDPYGSEVIELYGQALTGGYAIKSPGVAGNFITLICRTTGVWTTLGASGLWVTNGS